MGNETKNQDQQLAYYPLSIRFMIVFAVIGLVLLALAFIDPGYNFLYICLAFLFGGVSFIFLTINYDRFQFPMLYQPEEKLKFGLMGGSTSSASTSPSVSPATLDPRMEKALNAAYALKATGNWLEAHKRLELGAVFWRKGNHFDPSVLAVYIAFDKVIQALQLRQQNNIGEELKLFKEAQDLWNNIAIQKEPVYTYLNAQFLMYYADSLVQAYRLQDAEKQYELAEQRMQSIPTLTDDYLNFWGLLNHAYGVYLNNQSNHDKAIQVLREGISYIEKIQQKQDGDHYIAFVLAYSLGQIYYNKADFSSAETWYITSQSHYDVIQNPDEFAKVKYIQYLYSKAELHEEQNNLTDAITVLQKADNEWESLSMVDNDGTARRIIYLQKLIDLCNQLGDTEKETTYQNKLQQLQAQFDS